MPVSHTPKAGATLTGTEYEADDHHVIALEAADIPTHSHAGEDITSGTVADGRVASTLARDSEVTSAVSTHEAAADPHTGYLKESDFGGVDFLVGTATGITANEIVVGTTPGGELGGTWASPTVDATHAGGTHLTLGTTPSTQAFADAAAGGSASTASKNDHKHAMPTLGYGLSGNSAPAVGLTTASAYTTATTSISAATYADITGASVSLAAGTWLVIGTVTGSIVNAHALMHVALTDNANAIVSEQSGHIAASGSANVASNGSVTVVGIVSPGSTTTYKLRAARGNTTLTGTWVAMDGAGVGITNNLTDNSDKGTGIFAVRIA